MSKFTPEELQAFKAELCKGASESQFQLFIAEAEARDLRPGVHLFFQLRNSKEWDADVKAKVNVSKATWITTIAALRLISQRTGQDAGRGKTRWIYLDEQNRPTIESTIPLPHPDTPQLPREPYACVVPIYRKDYREPIEVVCRFEAYAVTFKTDNGPVLTEMWARRGPEQLEKCTEAATRRATYPESLGSLYLAEEFKSEQEDDKPTAVTPASVVPLPPTAPPVNQKPAEPTNTARSNEPLFNEKLKDGLAANKIETKLVWEKVGGGVVTSDQLQEVEKRIEIGKTKTPEPSTLVTPQPDTAAVEAAKAAVPSIQTAAEILPPKKRGRKPKENPDNGQKPVDGGITDTDISSAGEPAPETVTEQDKAEGAAFVESLDPTPTKEEMTGFTARVRALTAAGAVSAELKNYILDVGKKADTKLLTVGNWTEALDKLEAIPKDQLKEVTKNAPLPAF